MYSPSFNFRHNLKPSKLESAKDRGERRALERIGAFIRRRAKTDVLRRTAAKGTRGSVRRVRDGVVRKVQEVARPGRPPIVRSRSGVASLKNIKFHFSPSAHAVYIGPVGIGKRLRGSTEKTAAGLLERGGRGSVEQWQPDGSSIWSLGNVRRAGVRRRTVRARYHEHPFMGVALEREVAAGTLGDSFKGQIY